MPGLRCQVMLLTASRRALLAQLCRGCVPSGTVDWVVERASALPRVPSLAFIHIPLPQFRELWNSQPTRGTKGEAVACPLRDTGVYEAFRQAAPLGCPSDVGCLQLSAVSCQLAWGRWSSTTHPRHA